VIRVDDIDELRLVIETHTMIALATWTVCLWLCGRTAPSIDDYARPSDWRHPLATVCPECGALQFACPAGTSCENGHGYP
jgi:hypothetical protein